MSDWVDDIDDNNELYGINFVVVVGINEIILEESRECSFRIFKCMQSLFFSLSLSIVAYSFNF